MASEPFSAVIQHIHQIAGVPTADDPSDRQLLEHFAVQHDESAFAALMKRHGALVLSVCRRVLKHNQDAEDVFQATFLVLARKAASMRWREFVGFAARTKATGALEKMGTMAGPALRKALAAKPSLEVRQRLERLLDKLDGPITSSEILQMLRALQVLEHIDSPEAREILRSLAKGAPQALLTQEAKVSLQRLTNKILK